MDPVRDVHFYDPFQKQNIGRRTGKNLFAGNKKLIQSNGVGNFSDFFSESDTSYSLCQSPAIDTSAQDSLLNSSAKLSVFKAPLHKKETVTNTNVETKNTTATLTDIAVETKNTTAALTDEESETENTTAALTDEENETKNTTAALIDEAVESKNTTATLTDKAVETKNTTAALTAEAIEVENTYAALTGKAVETKNTTAALTVKAVEIKNTTGKAQINAGIEFQDEDPLANGQPQDLMINKSKVSTPNKLRNNSNGLDFAGNVTGSVSLADKGDGNQFFGIKKRLTFSKMPPESTFSKMSPESIVTVDQQPSEPSGSGWCTKDIDHTENICDDFVIVENEEIIVSLIMGEESKFSQNLVKGRRSKSISRISANRSQRKSTPFKDISQIPAHNNHKKNTRSSAKNDIGSKVNISRKMSVYESELSSEENADLLSPLFDENKDISFTSGSEKRGQKYKTNSRDFTNFNSQNKLSSPEHDAVPDSAVNDVPTNGKSKADLSYLNGKQSMSKKVGKSNKANKRRNSLNQTNSEEDLDDTLVKNHSSIVDMPVKGKNKNINNKIPVRSKKAAKADTVKNNHEISQHKDFHVSSEEITDATCVEGDICKNPNLKSDIGTKKARLSNSCVKSKKDRHKNKVTAGDSEDDSSVNNIDGSASKSSGYLKMDTGRTEAISPNDKSEEESDHSHKRNSDKRPLKSSRIRSKKNRRKNKVIAEDVSDYLVNNSSGSKSPGNPQMDTNKPESVSLHNNSEEEDSHGGNSEKKPLKTSLRQKRQTQLVQYPTVEIPSKKKRSSSGEMAEKICSPHVTCDTKSQEKQRKLPRQSTQSKKAKKATKRTEKNTSQSISPKKIHSPSSLVHVTSIQSTPTPREQLHPLSMLPRLTPKSGVSFRTSIFGLRTNDSSVCSNRKKKNVNVSDMQSPVSSKRIPTLRKKAIMNSIHSKKTKADEIIELNDVTGYEEMLCVDSNETVLPSPSTSPVHYLETTMSKRRSNILHLPNYTNKIVPPEEATNGLRRSKRTRVKRLNHYSGEEIVYRRDSSGFGLLVDTVELSTGAIQFYRKEQERQRQRTKKKFAMKSIPAKSKRLSSHRAAREDITDATELPIVNPETNETVMIELVARANTANWIGPDLEKATPVDPIAVSLLLKQPAFVTGELQMRPFCEKVEQLVTQTVIYMVMRGKVSVTINKVSFEVQTGDDFFVPRGTSYRLLNLRKDIAKLKFLNLNDDIHNMSEAE